MKTSFASEDIDLNIALRLKALRKDRAWSLDQLAKYSKVSRATLSRIENGDVSPTAAVLGKLCSVYELTMSRLIRMAETDFDPMVSNRDQTLWQDTETGFKRKSISPPSEALAAEILACEIPAGTRIAYRKPPRAGLEHHLIMQSGTLQLTIEEQIYQLEAGDCLRYQLFGPSIFETPDDQIAKYMLVIV